MDNPLQFFQFLSRRIFQVHQGETDGPAWILEPHIRHNNTIQTNGANLRKTISIPFECEWPTTSVGADPLSFTLGGTPYRFGTNENLILNVKMTLYQDKGSVNLFNQPILYHLKTSVGST